MNEAMNTVSYTMIQGKFSFLLPEFLAPNIAERNCTSENGSATVTVKLSVCRVLL